jgi:hypothetical protein
MEYLKVKPDYIHILLEDGSAFMEYLNENPKPKCVYISHTIEYDFNWGWFEDDDVYINEILSDGTHIYCGEINLRKEKLKRLKNLKNLNELY